MSEAERGWENKKTKDTDRSQRNRNYFSDKKKLISQENESNGWMADIWIIHKHMDIFINQ